MEKLEKESFDKFECLNCELEDLREMIWLMQEDCFLFKIDKYDNWEIRDKFRTAQIMTKAIYDLLNYKIKENDNFINKVHAEKKVGAVNER